MNFNNDITEIHSTAQALPMKCPSGSARMIYQLWQSSCRKWEGKKKVVVEICGGIKKKRRYVYNIFITNHK